MTNPPPFQVPDGNEPEQQPPVPPQGQGGAAGQPWQPPANPQQGQWQPPAGQQFPQQQPAQQPQYQAPGGHAAYPPPNPQQQYQPPAQQYQPPAAQQYQPPAGQQPYQQPGQQPYQAPAEPPYVPPQQGQPQWSGGGGYAAPAPSPAPYTQMPPPAGPAQGGPPPNPQSGPGSYPRTPPPQPGHTGPFPGPGASGQSMAYTVAPGTPGQLHLGPPRPPRPAQVRRSLLSASALAAAVVLVLAGIGVVHEADRKVGHGLGKAQEQGDVLWSILEGRDGPTTPEKAPLDRIGAWFTDTTVVVAEAGRLVSYNLDTGKTEWEYKSAKGELVCDVSPQGDAKYALAAFGDKTSCRSLEAVDIATGKQVWATDAAGSASDLDLPPSLAGVGLSSGIMVSGDVAVFAQQAYSVADGKLLWDWESKLPKNCSGGDFLGGKRLIATWQCGVGGGSNVGEIDPATGQIKWTYAMKTTSALQQVSVKSVDPVIVAAASIGNREGAVYVVLDEQGQEAFRPDGHPVVNPAGTIDAMTGAVNALSSDKILYLPGSDMSGSMKTGADAANQITAYDRATGQKLWAKTIAAGMNFGIKTQGKVYPLRVDENGDLLALAKGGSRPMHLVRIAAADGTVTNLKEFPSKATYAANFVMSATMFERDGRVLALGVGYYTNPNAKPADFLGQTIDMSQAYYRVIAMR
ncbi:outer membrane protein assembly factor BamB family protein [Yinghuangia soli]|uniref:PQQ-binding-like beta-propeller repeat protein n=1 Tax=Yinghuangia soli TaxID=2908204 RepID=A0AA41TXH9_9ACTN|nr:PQQ-binding-like beta-propeller repeat protein [Yinghuangia soli]MCF2526858.1 PQQ-binding-like beta-propeller repeat protein [Yinghuangia soli]